MAWRKLSATVLTYGNVLIDWLSGKLKIGLQLESQLSKNLNSEGV